MEEIDSEFGRFCERAEERYNLMRSNGDLRQRFTGAPFVLSYVPSDFSKASSWKLEWFAFVYVVLRKTYVLTLCKLWTLVLNLCEQHRTCCARL
jgi:hypothetical protein